MTEPFLSINDVSKQLEIPAHTLRYWEKQFPTAIKPATGAGGRRYYRPETVGAISAIKELLYDKGMTIAGVKKVVKDGKLSNVGADIIRPIAPQGATALSVAKRPTGQIISAPTAPPAYIGRAIELLELAKAELL